MLRRLMLLILATFVLATPVLSATLHGTIYTSDLSVAKDVVVTINTQPLQRLLSRDGQYSFDVPPGNYTLTVHYVLEGENETVHEEVVVAQEGNFSYDLFLFPSLEDTTGELENLSSDLALLEPEKQRFPWQSLLLGAALLAGILVIANLLSARTPQSDDLTLRILSVIKRAGGRITQKELRKQVPYSEAKVSLVLAELAAKGLVEKIKRGRGNIILLKKK